MRHEFIALHQTNNPQLYPECPQIVVTGSGTAEPGSSYKAAIDSNIKLSWFRLLTEIFFTDSFKGPHQRPLSAAGPPSGARAAPPSPGHSRPT